MVTLPMTLIDPSQHNSPFLRFGSFLISLEWLKLVFK